MPPLQAESLPFVDFLRDLIVKNTTSCHQLSERSFLSVDSMVDLVAIAKQSAVKSCRSQLHVFVDEVSQATIRQRPSFATASLV